MRARDSAVAYSYQSSDGRQVGQAGERSTIFPRAEGSQRTNSVLSANFGRMIASAVTGRPFVPGLHPSIVPSSERSLYGGSALIAILYGLFCRYFFGLDSGSKERVENVFAVMSKAGAPRTMFKPDDGMAYWEQQKARETRRQANRRARDDDEA